MLTDSVYRIGHGHEVCQDYALHGSRNDIHYAVISDGCSGSQDVDIGARLLAHQFAAMIPEVDGDEHLLSTVHWWEQAVPRTVYRMADSNRRDMFLENPACLDATLLSVVRTPTALCVSIFGDGFFFYVEKEEPLKLHVHEYEYTRNTPYYLSVEYSGLIPRDQFLAVGQDLKETYFSIEKVGTSFVWSKPEIRIRPVTERPRQIWSRPELTLFAGVASDGWSTFFNKETQDVTNVSTIFSHFMEFPVVSENFLKRQMHGVLKRLDKQNLQHYDDLSMAVIYNNEG